MMFAQNSGEREIRGDVCAHVTARAGHEEPRGDDEVASQSLERPEPEHEVDEERDQEHTAADERGVLGQRENRHHDGTDTEQRGAELDGERIPALIEAPVGRKQANHEHRQLQPEAHDIRHTASGVQHPVIDDGKTARRHERDEQAQANPTARGACVIATKLLLERLGEAQPPIPFGEYARNQGWFVSCRLR